MAVNKDIFITTLIIVIFIFFLGFLIGYKLDTYRVDDANLVISQSELDSQSLIIENDFMDSFATGNCQLIQTRIQSMSDKLGEVGNLLTKYDNKKISNKIAYETLKQRYFLLEIKVYTLEHESEKLCSNNPGTTILFFYDVDDDQESLKQGYALDSLVKDLQNVTVFSINREFNDTTIQTVKQFYNIKQSPTLIIDFSTKKEGYVSEGELRAFIQDKTKNPN